jgi:hypothetical protein
VVKTIAWSVKAAGQMTFTNNLKIVR